jgi:HAD superfamily hydrolase (TIGR01490 family)
MERKVAMFDIDGTIFRSSLLIELVESLIAEGVIPPAAAKLYAKEHLSWLNRKGTYEDYILAVVDAFNIYIKGVEYEPFMRACEATVEKHQDRVYRYTRDLVAELKKKNYYLLAISHSPKGMLDSFCKKLGFDKVYGRFYELGPADKFTGEVVDLHLIANKSNIVKRAVEKEGLTLKGSVAVGDTESDIPMLELADHPICFNPNNNLYRHAKRNDWRVTVERKDVIYEIN